LEVLVDEGTPVEAGQILLLFNDEDLIAQLAQAEANLAVAQANYELTVAATQTELLSCQQALDDLYLYADIARAEAEVTVANTRDAVRDAERYLNNLIAGSRDVDIVAARANLVLLQDRLEDAQEDFEKYENRPETNTTRANLEINLANAERAYEDAVRLLNNLEAEANDIEIAIAEANLSLANAQLIAAEIDLEDLAEGPDPDTVAQLEASIQAIEAQIPLAAAQVQAAEANLFALQLQEEKLSIEAPISGVILFRNAEPGEVVAPSTTLLTIVSLDKITVTVYIPEDQYGQINLGDIASVTTDSFPNLSFDAIVIHIADEAEYTPRNVQTEEERRNTVFAIKLTLADNNQQIKPGMPVDVVFSIDSK
jgi:multidrug resistance efflux pump